MVASKAKPRGLLIREDGQPHTAESLARVTRLPHDVIEACIARLLEIGLLETGDNKPRKKSTLRSHPGARIPQEPAVSPQEGAVEGKGREHHHQEQKGTEKKGTRAEKKGRGRAREELTTEDSRASASAAATSSQNGDDADENPRVEYASPEDELKAIYQAKTGEPITPLTCCAHCACPLG